jgi:HJR/Mrr/RecB family endonuclease
VFTREQLQALSSIDDIAKLSPRDFEWFTKFLLEKKGHTGVFVTEKHGELNGDGGVDVRSFVNGKKVYTQCKKWSPSFKGTFRGFLPVRVIRELGGCMLRDKVTDGLIVTTLSFESLDRKEAALMNVQLIGREEIVAEMQLINPNFGKRAHLRITTIIWRILFGIVRIFILGIRELFFR